MATMHVEIAITGPRGCGKTRMAGVLNRAMKDAHYMVVESHMVETRLGGIPSEVYHIEIDTRPRDAMGVLRL